MYRIVIDRSLCSGYGMCVDAAPAVIELDDEGLARLRVIETDDESAVAAAAACPMEAISVERVELPLAG